MNDGKPLYSTTHKRLVPWWKWLLGFLVRPKMTESNLETFYVSKEHPL